MSPTKATASFTFFGLAACDVVQDGSVGEDGTVLLLLLLPPCLPLKLNPYEKMAVSCGEADLCPQVCFWSLHGLWLTWTLSCCLSGTLYNLSSLDPKFLNDCDKLQVPSLWPQPTFHYAWLAESGFSCLRSPPCWMGGKGGYEEVTRCSHLGVRGKRDPRSLEN